MKANEVPEKIYIFEQDFQRKDHKVMYGVNQDKDIKGLIEYTRTDAFIEKALKWYCLDCECNDNCKDTKCFFHNEYKRFLEGNKNACPPKFECTILNPNGTTSDNWRYRHFTLKMQDAFMEKAKKWFEKWDEWFEPNGNRHCDMESFEDFRKYIKGE